MERKKKSQKKKEKRVSLSHLALHYLHHRMQKILFQRPEDLKFCTRVVLSDGIKAFVSTTRELAGLHLNRAL